MKADLKAKKFKDFSYAFVASYRQDPAYNGKNIMEIAKIARGRDSVNDQVEQMLEMYEKGGASMVYRMMDEQDVRYFMRQPFTMIASDSGVREFGSGVPHPRGYGNNTRVLGKYVRELKSLTLEDAIRKMTSLPAQTFGLTGRGSLSGLRLWSQPGTSRHGPHVSHSSKGRQRSGTGAGRNTKRRKH